jgi:lysyl-tRNA synthetase class 2
MPFTSVVIDADVKRDFPEARIGWLVSDVVVTENHPYVEEVKKNLASRIASMGVTEENFSQHPDIARWRAIYSAMGVKPSKYRSSLEALVRRVVKGQEMWSVSSVVDCYDCASATTFLPMGAHDATKLDGALTLRYGVDGETFLPLGGNDEIVRVDTRNIVYADRSKVCCWLWNHRDTRLACVTAETKEAIFIVDSAFKPQVTQLEKGIEFLAEFLEKIGCTPKTSGIAE